MPSVPDAADGLSVHLHPLVLINASDHIVRFRHTGRAQQRVLGALLGTLEGRKVEVHTSFELLIGEESMGDSAIDEEFFKQRLAQYLEVFPKYEFLGWYSTGTSPQESDKTFHKKLQELGDNETPFVLLVDAEKLSAGKVGQTEDLPVSVFDSTTHLENGMATVEWKRIPYEIDTLEGERIAVNHVSKSATTTSTGQGSESAQHSTSLTNSVVMLNNRIKELLEYMKDVKAGRQPKNHEILRQLLAVCQAFRTPQDPDQEREFCAEYNDASLIVLLGTLTKACAGQSELLDKFYLAVDRKHYSRQRPFPWG
mmetsp:Transcript_25771/g.39199  ORF Transcript_25771/g.39199 Transcript_25771/m.39199 type:complete len:311 (+) Transcript_25771:151-1083(+)